MARILICHIPKDGGLARDLGSLLMGRGHFVSFDGDPDVPKDDRPQRLRQFEAVIVVWTETSALSPGLTDIAAETMPLNLLVPVRSETLSPHALPLKFRKLNMFGPRDIDGLSRLVVRLSQAQTQLREMSAREAQREAYTPPPPETVYPPLQPMPQPQASLRPQPQPQPQPQLPAQAQALHHHQPQHKFQQPPQPQERARAVPSAEPQKPQLPVFVKLRPPVPPAPAQVSTPLPPPQAQEPAPAPPRQERPSFPPRIQRTAEPQPAPPAPAPVARTAPPLPPFVTRRLLSKDAAAEATPPKAEVPPPPVAEPRRTTAPPPTSAPLIPSTQALPTSARTASAPLTPAPPPVAEERGHERAWKALADELSSLVNPAGAPPITRPHAPFGRAPLMSRTPAPKPEPEREPPPQPETVAKQYPPPAPPDGRARNEVQPFSSLRPQSAVPPPLPSKDSMALGSPSFSAVAMAQHLARLVEAGLLLIYIPEITSLGSPITTEVRLGREVLSEAQGPSASATDRLLIDTISVSLICDGPGFSIERQSERTQFVGERFREHSAVHGNGRWVWLVTPHSQGDFDLIVRISALVRDRSGVPTPVALPDRRYAITVQAREARAR